VGAANFTNNSHFCRFHKKFMLMSRETIVDYMTPLGLHHIMGTGFHYGPLPGWIMPGEMIGILFIIIAPIR
jgi:alpha-glucuronidase